MMASRGMGCIAPSKMPTAKRKARRDDTDFDQYAEGGEVKKFRTGGDSTEDYPPQFRSRADYEKFLKASEESRKKPKKPEALGPLDINAFEKPFAGEYRSWEEKEHPEDDRKAYKKGGKVNAAGNYTKPGLRKKIVAQVKAAATHGTGAGQWSARKAQLVAKKYKAAGGGYRD